MKLTKKEASFITMCISIAEDETHHMAYDKSKDDLYQRLCAFASFEEDDHIYLKTSDERTDL